MKKLFYTLCMTLLATTLFGQIIQERNGTWQTTFDKKNEAKDKNANLPIVRSTSGCSDILFDQDVGLEDHVGGLTHIEIGNTSSGQSKGYDDFTLFSTVTIETVILNMTEFKYLINPESDCISPELQINFRSDIDGSYGSIIHSRTMPAGAATLTKEGQFRFLTTPWINIYHFPVAPVTLPAGTYWLEVYAPEQIQSQFNDGLYWNKVNIPISGATAFTTGPDPIQVGNFAFSFCGEETNPAPLCATAIEAVCQNTTVSLQPGGTASISASDVDGGSSGFTNISVSPSTFNCSNLGANTVTLTVDDGAGNSATCPATVTVLDDQGLPNSWDANNIGTAPSGNTFNFDACNGSTVSDQFVIGGGGNNAINLMSDNIAFASQTLCGDGSITAKIENVDASGYGGLMIRETTAAGSKQVAIFSNMSSILRHESRTMTNMPKTIQSFFKPSPTWLRMRRQGDWVHVEYSNNGMMYLPVQSTFVMMSSCVEIGLASFTFLPMGQTSATFSNVATTGTIQDLSGDTPTTFAVDPSIPQNQNTKTPQNLQLFPNPTSHHFTLQLETPLQEEALVEVINLYGQSMAQQRLGAGQVVQQWNVANWPVGTYMMRLNRAGQAPMVKQFVVSR